MKVALSLTKLMGEERQRDTSGSQPHTYHGISPCSSDSDDVAPDFASSIVRILLLIGVFAALVTMLPLPAHAEDNSLPPLTYEVRDPIVPGSLALAPFTLPPPQWRSVEQMSKSERRAMLVQLAAETVVSNSTLNALKSVWLAVREPIRSDDGSLSCKTKLSMHTYFMRCSLKF